MYTIKNMLKPNNKQKTRIRKTALKCIECQNIVYDYLDSIIKNKEKFPNVYEVRKWFTKQKEIKDNEVIKLREGLSKLEQREKHLDVLFYDVSNDALKQMVKDTYNAFIRFFKKLGKYPQRKTYKDYKKSFYVDPYKIEFSDKYVKLEKISLSMKSNRQVLNNIKLTEWNRIPVGVKYYNPRVVIEGDRIWISVGIDDEYAPKKNHNKEESEAIGIDVNIHSIDLSNGEEYKSPIGKKKVRRIEKSIKRLQRKASKQYELAKKENRNIKECKNLHKTWKKINKKKRRLKHIMEEFHNQVITKITNNKPKAISIEDLDIKEMVKHHKLAKNIQYSSWRKFFTRLKEKCDKMKIPLRQIEKYYPSSKRCSRCGNVKKELSLKERTYICLECGFVIKRDLNAAINIRDYYKFSI